MLQSVLSIANKEQNMAIPPEIYSSQYNTVTSLLINKLVELFPDDDTVVDMLMPFMEKVTLPVQNGYITLPDNYRNILGSPSTMAVSVDGKECNCTPPEDNRTFEDKKLESACKSNPIIIVPNSEWDYRTRSTYDFPTLDNPIGCFFGNKQLKVCPYNILRVELRYVRQEKVYKYGYIIQPDDTYVFDPATSIESEWTSAAYTPIYNAMIALYSAYTRDNDLSNWSQFILEKKLI